MLLAFGLGTIEAFCEPVRSLKMLLLVKLNLLYLALPSEIAKMD